MMMVFDWDKAKELIKKYENLWRADICAEAYLKNDMGNTVGTIYQEGKIVLNDNPYTSSMWATPMLSIWDIYDHKRYIFEECYYFENDIDKANTLARAVWPNIW